MAGAEEDTAGAEGDTAGAEVTGKCKGTTTWPLL